MIFYKKAYKQAVAARDEWRKCYLKSADEKACLELKLNKLKDDCDWFERENAKLRTSEGSTFDKGDYQRLKKKNAELEEQLKAAEGKLSARTEADKTFKDNCCFGLAFLGGTVRKLNKQDEERTRREEFLFRAVEGLMNECAELKRRLGEEPGRAITIGEPRAEKETEQPESKKKAKDKKNDK